MDILQGRVREELTSTINMNVLLISHLLEGAQDSNVSLDLDASAVENQVLIQSIEKMNIDAMPKGGRKAVDALVILLYIHRIYLK